jgi:hypothetical protein
MNANLVVLRKSGSMTRTLLETAPKHGLYFPHNTSEVGHDILDILYTLGDHIRSSEWEFSSLDLNDSNRPGIAKALYDAEECGGRIGGIEFLETVRQVLQVIEGNFFGFAAPETTPWIHVKAQDGCCFSVLTSNEEVLGRLRSRFSSVQVV